MHSPHCRYQFFVHRYKGLVLLFILFLSCSLFAQEKREHNYTAYDRKLISYGFYLAPNYTLFDVKLSEDFIDRQDTLTGVYPKINPSFAIGFIIRIKLHDYVDFRFMPGAGFYNRELRFDFTDETSLVESFEFNYVELPFLFKYKSKRRNNTRIYAIGGIKPCIEVGSKRNERKPTQLRTVPSDLTLEYGIGIDLYYPLTKFSPELRFSHGIRNIRNRDPNVYANVIDRLTTHTVSLVLNIE